MPRLLPLHLRVILAFMPLLLGTVHDAQRAFGDEAEPPNAQSTQPAIDQQLIQRHNELVPRIKRLWHQGHDSEAYQGLQELLALYQEIYPTSKSPAGHEHIVRCYRDLCRLSGELGKTDALLKYSQDGLTMCRQLFPANKAPHGHIMTASMLANLGHAWLRRGEPTKARQYLTQSLHMNKKLQEHDLPRFGAEAVAELHMSVSSCCSLQGYFPQALDHATKALKSSKKLPDTTPHLDQLKLSADCHLTHGQALTDVGDYQAATQSLQQALDHSLYVFLTLRSEASRLTLIDAHTILGVLHRHKSNIPQAKSHLRKALELVEGMKEGTRSLRGRKQEALLQLIWVLKLEGMETRGVGYAEELRKELTTRSEILLSDFGTLPNSTLKNGITYQLLGEMDSAQACYRAAYAAIAAKQRSRMLNQETIAGFLVHDLLADTFYIDGRYDQSSFHFLAALAAARRVLPYSSFEAGHRFLVQAIANAATQLWLLGETEPAAALYREAMSMCERLYPEKDYPRGHRQLMAAYSAWGNVLEREGDYEEATTYFSKAHQIALAQFPEAEYPDGHDELALVWQDLGRLARSQKHCEKALKYFRKALTSYQKRYSVAFPDGHLSIALMLSEIGRTYCAVGDDEQGEKYLRRSLEIRRRLFPAEEFPNGHPNLARALRDLGRLLHSTSRYDDAFSLFTHSARMEQAVAESFVGGSSEALLLNLAARKFQSLDCLLATWSHTTRPASEPYRLVWQRRGFVPRLIAKRQRALRQLASADKYTQIEAYLGARRDLSRALLVPASGEPGSQATDLKALRQLNSRKEDLETRLTRELASLDARSWQQEGTPGQLAEELPPNTVLVDYVRYRSHAGASGIDNKQDAGPARMLAFLIMKDHPVIAVPLGDADHIAKLARRWRSEIRNGKRNGFGDKLRRLVWDPVSQRFPEETKTVYVAPDDALSLIPWNALPVPDTSAFLIEQYAIATVPHGPFLLESLRSKSDSTEETGRILAVGDLDFGKQEDTDNNKAVGLKEVIWRPLPGSSSELESVTAAAGSRTCVQLTGSQATTETVITHLPTCRWAHFATHGFFLNSSLRRSLNLAAHLKDGQELSLNRSRIALLRRSPFVRSGLALSGANRLGEVDESGLPRQAIGILTAETIATVDCTGLDLVVLSACESGQGDVVHGDGVFGLQTAFHVAGARNVIASLWKIDDQATADLMSRFYRLLWKQNRQPLAALRAAQLEMLRQSGKTPHSQRGPVLAKSVPLPRKTAHPERAGENRIRHWAAFTLSGSGF